jgi:Family of unknown function (DUF5709)
MSTLDGASESPEGDFSVDDDDQLQPADTLIDRGVDDILDEGYSPPERPYGHNVGTTPRERHDGESLDQLLSEEEPDPAMQIDDSDDDERETEFPEPDEVGDVRAGRLAASGPDGSDGLDDDGEMFDDDGEMSARDVGIDGGAASAEEAAVHIISDAR